MSQRLAKLQSQAYTNVITGIGKPTTGLSGGVVYQALTDGIVIGWNGAGWRYLYCDQTTSPSTVISAAHASAGGGGDFAAVMGVVPKGYYWQVTTGTASFTPIGVS